MTKDSLLKVKSIAERSWPALSDNWSWKPNFGLFESDLFTQVLLYVASQKRKENYIWYFIWTVCQQTITISYQALISSKSKKLKIIKGWKESGMWIKKQHVHCLYRAPDRPFIEAERTTQDGGPLNTGKVGVSLYPIWLLYEACISQTSQITARRIDLSA